MERTVDSNQINNEKQLNRITNILFPGKKTKKTAFSSEKICKNGKLNTNNRFNMIMQAEKQNKKAHSNSKQAQNQFQNTNSKNRNSKQRVKEDKYNLNNQIQRFKREMQTLLQKQDIRHQSLKNQEHIDPIFNEQTQRHFLQGVQSLSNRIKIQDFPEQIQLASETLLTYLPTHDYSVKLSQYYKISVLCKTLSGILKRKAIIYQEQFFSCFQKNFMSFKLNKKMPKNRVLLRQKQREIKNLKMAFNKWHYNSMHEKSTQTLAQYKDELSIPHLGNLIKLLPKEGNLVHYIQSSILNNGRTQSLQNNENFYEIVLYNKKAETLKAFHNITKTQKTNQHQNIEFQSMNQNNKSTNSYFQSLSNYSILKQIDHVDADKNQEKVNLQTLSGVKLKQFEFSLEKNSITHMCIENRQILKTTDLLKNPQYSKIDGRLDMQDIVNSARSDQSARMVGKSMNAVFYPLLINNQVIGVIRAYGIFHNNYLRARNQDFPAQQIQQKQIELITQLIYVSIGLSSKMRVMSEQAENFKQGYYIKFIRLLKVIEAVPIEGQLDTKQTKTSKKSILRMYQTLQNELGKIFSIQQFQVYQIEKVEKQLMKQVQAHQVIKGVYLKKIYKSMKRQIQNDIDDHILPMIKIFDANRIEYIPERNHHVFKIGDLIYDMALVDLKNQRSSNLLSQKKMNLPIALLQKVFRRIQYIFTKKQEQKQIKQKELEHQKTIQNEKQCLVKAQLCERQINKLFSKINQVCTQNSVIKAIQKFLKRVTHDNDSCELLLYNSRTDSSFRLIEIGQQNKEGVKINKQISSIQLSSDWKIQFHYTFRQTSTAKCQKDIIETLRTFIQELIKNQAKKDKSVIQKQLVSKAKRVFLELTINNEKQVQNPAFQNKQDYQTKIDQIMRAILNKIFEIQSKVITSEDLSKQIRNYGMFPNKEQLNVIKLFSIQRKADELQIPKKVRQILKSCQCFDQGQKSNQISYFNICQQKNKVAVLYAFQKMDDQLIKELIHIYKKISDKFASKSRQNDKKRRLKGATKMFDIFKDKILCSYVKHSFMQLVQSRPIYKQIASLNFLSLGLRKKTQIVQKIVFRMKVSAFSKLKLTKFYDSQRQSRIKMFLSKLVKFGNQLLLQKAFSLIDQISTDLSVQTKQLQKQQQQRLQNYQIAFSRLYNSIIKPSFETPFLMIYTEAMKKKSYNHVGLLLSQPFKTAQRKAFKSIQKFSQHNQCKLQKTIIGQISRSKSFKDIFKVVASTRPQVQIAYKINMHHKGDNQNHFLLSKNMSIVNEDRLFDLYKGFQHFQSVEKGNKVIWFYFKDSVNTFQTLDISFKNQLTVISKAIVETATRNIQNQKAYLSLINVVSRTSQRNEVKWCFEIWRKLTLDQVILQTYGQRQKIYHLNLESQTLKEKIRVKVRENEQNQAVHSKLQKKKQEALNKIDSLRNKIIQLDTSSNQLEKQCKIALIKKSRSGMRHYFRQWRLNIAKNFMQRKQNIIDICFLKEALKLVEYFMEEKKATLMKECFRQLTSFYVQYKVQEESINSQRMIEGIRQQQDEHHHDNSQQSEEISQTIYQQLQEYQHSFFIKQNPRLLTFQNNSDNQQSSSRENMRKEVDQQSTPVNYRSNQRQPDQNLRNKQYIAYQSYQEQSHQDEYRFVPFNKKDPLKHDRCELTPQDIKKANQGKYKLNLKTLKFLKRMGKLQDI